MRKIANAVFVLLLVAIFACACKNDDTEYEPSDNEFAAPHVAYRVSWNKCKFGDVNDFLEGHWKIISKFEGNVDNYRQVWVFWIH